MRKLDLTGQKFGRLTCLEFAEEVKYYAWHCQCECGNKKIVRTSKLTGGYTKSCGCLNTEKRLDKAKQMNKAVTKYSPQIASARRAWKKRYDDGLSFEDFISMSQKNCYYCGAGPSNISNAAKCDKKSSQFAKDNGDFSYNGLDRIDSSKPHTIDNVVPCCKYCNYAKRERTLKKFVEWIQKLASNLPNIARPQ